MEPPNESGAEGSRARERGRRSAAPGYPPTAAFGANPNGSNPFAEYHHLRCFQSQSGAKP